MAPKSMESKPSEASTGSVQVKTRFRTQELNNLTLPVQIRKGDLSLVAHTFSGQIVSGLEYGQKYLVLAQLPAGHTLMSEVTISRRSKSPTEVILEPREWQQSPHESDEVQHFLGNPSASILPRINNQLLPGRGLLTSAAAQFSSIPLEDLGARDNPEGELDALLSDYLEVPREVAQGRGMDAAGPALEAQGPEASLGPPATTVPPLMFRFGDSSIKKVPGFSRDEIEVRLFKGNALACSAAPQPIDLIVVRQVNPNAYKLSVSGAEGLWFLQVQQTGRPATNVALPISLSLGCEVVITRLDSGSAPEEGDAIALEVHMANVDANAMARYRSFGFISEAAAGVEMGTYALDADHLIGGSVQDPVAAAVGFYALLRFNRLKHINDWSDKLYRSFAWFPDGAAIRGEYLARAGRPREALEAFLNVASRGLPLFTEGLSFTMERLDLYLRASASELTLDETDRVRSVLPLLQRYVGVADPRKMVLRFNGSSPNLPGLEIQPTIPSTEKDSKLLRLVFEAEQNTALGSSTAVPTTGDRTDERSATASATGTTESLPPEWAESGTRLELMGPADLPPVPAPSGGFVMELSENVVAATEARYRDRATHRTGIQDRIAAASAPGGSILQVDDAQRVALRTQHVLRHPLVSKALDSVTDGRPLENLGTVEANHLLERILGGNNLLDAAFLDLGSAVAKSVARIQIRDQFRTIGFGTGFMISPRLILTNNHVLPDTHTARLSRAEFNFQNDIDGHPRTTRGFNLEPDTFFLTDIDLDFTLVAVDPQPVDDDTRSQLPLAHFGFNRVTPDQGKLLLGEPINVIQHPDGQPKQVALQQNELIDRLDHFIHYHTDTSPGSSGSPLYNNQWEVIGLHHSGVPERDTSGNILSIDGTIWTPNLGETRIKWVANEGVRISSIIERLATTTTLGPQQQVLLGDVLNPPIEDNFPPVPTESGTQDATHPGTNQPTVEDPEPSSPSSTAAFPPPALPRTSATAVTAAADGLSLTIPLVITVQVGDVRRHPGISPVSSTLEN